MGHFLQNDYKHIEITENKRKSENKRAMYTRKTTRRKGIKK